MFSLNKVLEQLPEEKKNEIVDKNVEGGFFFLFSKLFFFKKKRHGHHGHHGHSNGYKKKSRYGW